MLRFKLILSCLFFPSLFLFAQFDGVFVNELNEQDGIFYKKGEKYSGDAYDLNEKGRFITLETYKKGLLHGKRINYNSRDLTKLASEKFKNGRGLHRTYYNNNKLKCFGPINKSIKFGEWIYYDKKGVIKAKELWSSEVSNQLIWEKYYNKNGIIESEMFYELGILNREKYYDENGKLLKTNKN